MSVTTNANDTTRAATRNTIQRALVLEAVWFHFVCIR